MTSKSSDEEKENQFLAWVEWLLVTSQTHVIDNCKIRYWFVCTIYVTATVIRVATGGIPDGG